MIDWTGVNKSAASDWVGLTARLIGRAQTVLSTPEPSEDELRAVQEDLAELVRKANLSCPVSAINAARRASDQITLCLTAAAIEDLERRNERLDAIKARMSSAANELKADAAAIGLESVQRALTGANTVLAELKGLAAEVNSLSKAESADRIASIVKSVSRVVKEIETGVRTMSA